MRARAAQRRLHRLHRDAADRGRGGAHAARSSATTCRSTTSPQSIDDGATVPLYYENRMPELQLTNDAARRRYRRVIDEADLDEDAGGRKLRDGVRQAIPSHHQRRPARPGRPTISCATSSGAAIAARRCSSRSTRPPRCACTTRSSATGTGMLARKARGSRRIADAVERAAAEEQLEWLSETDMAVVVSLVAERNRADGEAGAWTSRRIAARMVERGPGREVQGRRRSAAARVCLRHVDHRLRRADLLDRLPRQADEEPHADADDRAREPGRARQAGGADRRLRRRVPQPARRRWRSTPSRAPA